MADDTKNALISVIMPCYNAAAYVEEAIVSVLEQTYPHNEVIVVDDGSQDASREIVTRLGEAHPGRIRLYQQDRKGPYPARNLGLSHARGEFVAFLDADDWWREDCLEVLLAALRDNDADLSYCGWQNVGERAANSEPYIPPAYESEDAAAHFLRGCPWPIHAALVRRSVLDAVGGFSERRFSSMDYDLWLRIFGHTQKIVRAPEVLAFYRWHGSGQISATKWRQVLDAVEVRRDFIESFPGLVDHLGKERLEELVDGQLLKEGYRAYWRRDLVNARRLFALSLRHRAWKARDLKYLVPALLPEFLFAKLVGVVDRKRGDERA